MTRTSQPTRLPADVYESALAATLVTSRTVPQQIAHRTRAGDVAGGEPPCDHPGPRRHELIRLARRAEAIVREEWADRMTALRGGLDYAAQFAAAGESSSEVDEDGNLYARLWGHLGAAIRIADVTAVLDNSSARVPFRPCASFEYGVLIGSLSWPTWTPYALREAEGSVDHGQRDGG